MRTPMLGIVELKSLTLCKIRGLIDFRGELSGSPFFCPLYNSMHLVSIDDLDNTQIQKLFERTEKIKQNPSKYRKKMKGKILSNLFYEPSTRTSSSFHAAMSKLGGDVISINDVTYSSVAKGENLEDTIITMGNYSDVIVLRSKSAGDAKNAANVSTVPIINAGDGNGEHPTQTLLDLYTIWERYGRIYNLTVTFIGDIKNGRTVRSLEKSLAKFNALHSRDTYNTKDLPKSDVYYFTRVQKERGSEGSYKMTKEMVDKFPDDCIVMHPFPRNEEIPRWFDNDPRAKYFEQMENGLYIRMALLLQYK
jgi:aspartate carbamoyltransferase catalytic subunit